MNDREAAEESGFRSAKRCLRSLSRRIPDGTERIPAEDAISAGNPDRLLAAAKNR
ncbi:MAG TPA: hypothetical protein VMC06_15190 [Opitutaceae bacterium]|nr:hypothetical protein [Opitutaceae bacterium]